MSDHTIVVIWVIKIFLRWSFCVFLTKSNLPWFMDLTFPVPMQYCSLQHWTLLPPPDTSILGIVFALAQPLHSFWSCSLLFSSRILGTYRLGKFILQCHIFLPFHTVHRILKARTLKWSAIPFSSRPHFVRTLHHDTSVLGSPTWLKAVSAWLSQSP